MPDMFFASSSVDVQVEDETVDDKGKRALSCSATLTTKTEDYQVLSLPTKRRTDLSVCVASNNP